MIRDINAIIAAEEKFIDVRLDLVPKASSFFACSYFLLRAFHSDSSVALSLVNTNNYLSYSST